MHSESGGCMQPTQTETGQSPFHMGPNNILGIIMSYIHHAGTASLTQTNSEISPEYLAVFVTCELFLKNHMTLFLN